MSVLFRKGENDGRWCLVVGNRIARMKEEKGKFDSERVVSKRKRIMMFF